MSVTIALVQHKGGAGKTTAVLGLALVAQAARKRCLVVDLDPQRIASRMIERENLTLEHTSQYDPNKPPGDFDLVWLDTPGLQAHETALALSVADVVVIPIRASMLDWLGCTHVIHALRRRSRTVLWLPSQVDTRRANDRHLPESLRNAMDRQEIPEWPILPGIKALTSVADVLSGRLRGPSAENFRDNYKHLKRFLKETSDA